MKKQNNFKDWLTHFEKSNQLESPDYENTLKYFQKFVDNTPYVNIKTIGDYFNNRLICQYYWSRAER